MTKRYTFITYKINGTSWTCIKLFYIAILLLLNSCTTPPELIEKQAVSHGFTRLDVYSKGFPLILYQKKDLCAKNKIHVYIAGDGIPWHTRHSVAIDPTPPYALVLDLMANDKTSSLFLGRPCYYGTRSVSACHPMYWTHLRYSQAVVDSMTDALMQVLFAKYDECEATMIGFSGGGTLAMLIASRIPQVTKVVTIAGNLDIAAWSKFHSYSPLKGSLNPADLNTLPINVKQWHLLAGADEEVPPMLVEHAINRQPNTHILYFEDFSHDCCWKTIWASILEKISNSDY